MEILQAFWEGLLQYLFVGLMDVSGPQGGAEGFFQILQAHWVELKS